jgi:ABC-2 type transport system permease protein
MNKFRAALVIARRDYIATVWSRAFLLFLIGPLLPIIFGVIFGSAGADMAKTPDRATIAVVAEPSLGKQLEASHTRLSSALGDVMPLMLLESPKGDRFDQVQHLLDRQSVAVVLDTTGTHPELIGTKRDIDQFGGNAALLLGDARRVGVLEAHHIMPEKIAIKKHPIQAAPAPRNRSARDSTARGGQMVLVVLTMILAGMLLSNLIEEKSNKVIEVLAAAVPVDAIFFGKLIAMLGMSLTGITIWGSVFLIGMEAFAPELIRQMAAPAVGWPAFVLLGLAYFMSSYLLLGALFLSIGAMASTVREVQTLSMPVTMGQLVIFGLASAAVSNPGGRTATAAAIFPWSSPLAMMARAAQRPEIWPHLLAIVWQAVWVVLIIVIGAGFFRRSVLKSGGPRWRGIRSIVSSSRAS